MQTRKGGRSRRLTVGRHGLISADRARTEAARIIADIKAGREPLRANGAGPGGDRPHGRRGGGALHARACRGALQADTVRQCRHTLDYYLLPVLGAEPLGAIRRERVAPLHYSLHETPVMANKVVDILSRLFLHGRGPRDRSGGWNASSPWDDSILSRRVPAVAHSIGHTAVLRVCGLSCGCRFDG